MRPIGSPTGQHLAVMEAGSGPLVLFLHGIGSSSASFAPQVAAFRNHFRCVCPDAPGYADSADLPMDGIDSYAAAFEEVVGAFGPTSPIGIVGVSFGGVIATRIARRAQLDVGALVLADTSPGSGVDVHRAQAMLSRADELDRLGADAFAAERSGSRPTETTTSAACEPKRRHNGTPHGEDVLCELEHQRADAREYRHTRCLHSLRSF